MSDTKTMIKALRILAQDIQSGDGIANMCIADAADMIERLERLCNRCVEPLPKCPITRRELFMVIDGNATYGGPFDSYTIPYMEGEPNEQWHERDLVVERFDHDAGTWADDETIPFRIVSEEHLFDLEEQIEKANQRVIDADDMIERLRGHCDDLEKQLAASTDQNDLLLDEFIRVKHLTDNTEIHALCERAHVRMRQNVSVIDRNHQLERKVSELKNKVNSLENSDGGLLLKALFYAPSSPVSAAKAEEIESWYEKVKRLNKEKNNAQA